MGSVLDCLPHGSRVALVRLRSLGDCVLTTPAIAILKRARPDVHLAVVVEERFRAIFEDNPDIDEILPPLVRPLRSFGPRLCINLHGGTRSAILSALSGAEQRAGFGHFRHQWIYNVHIPRAQEILGEERTVHTAEHVASAMFFLGARRVEIPRAFLGTKCGQAKAWPTGIIHAVAATPEKTWSAEGFVAAALRMREMGLDPVFIGASGDDLTPFREFRTVVGAPLGEVKELLASASFFVGNDSGPAHMAAAFGLPVVVIFGSSNPAIWGPWRTPSEIITSPHGIAAVETSQVLTAMARLKVAA